MPKSSAEVGMASMLYNPVETCTMIVQMELVIWLRSQATITHPVPYTQACTLICTERKLCLEENNSSANSFRDSWKNKVMVDAKKIFPKLRITNTVLPCLLRFAKLTEIGGEMTTDFQ